MSELVNLNKERKEHKMEKGAETTTAITRQARYKLWKTFNICWKKMVVLQHSDNSNDDIK